MLLRRLGIRSSLLLAISLSMIACSDKSFVPATAGQRLSSASGSAQPAGKTSTVAISQFSIRPETVTVTPGDTVEWKNTDAVPHTLVSQDGKTINSGNIAKHASWRFKAEKEGTYEYQCSIHPSMKGRVIVQSAQLSVKPSAAHAATPALARSRQIAVGAAKK